MIFGYNGVVSMDCDSQSIRGGMEMARVAFERFAPPEHRKVLFKLEMSAEFDITRLTEK